MVYSWHEAALEQLQHEGAARLPHAAAVLLLLLPVVMAGPLQCMHGFGIYKKHSPTFTQHIVQH